MAEFIIEFARAGAISKYGSADKVPWFPKKQGRPPGDATKEARWRAATPFDQQSHQLEATNPTQWARCKVCEDLARTTYPNVSQPERRRVVSNTSKRCIACDRIPLGDYHHVHG